MKKLTATIVLILILLLSTVFAAAADYSGTDIRLSNVKGTVSVANAAGKALTAKDNLRICDGYKVSTGADGTVYIKMDNSKAVMLQQSSEIIVKKTGSKLAVVLNKGTISADVSKKLDSKETLDIHTTTMVTGVRGTFLSMKHSLTERFLPKTSISLLEGQVDVALKNASSMIGNSTITLPAGSYAEAEARPRSQNIMSPVSLHATIDIPLWIPTAEGGISLGEGIVPDPVYKQFVITNGTVTPGNLSKQTLMDIKNGYVSEKSMTGMPEELKEALSSVDYIGVQEELNASIEKSLAIDLEAEKISENLSKIENDNVFEDQKDLKADRDTILLENGQGESVSIPSSGGGSNRPATYTVTINDNNVAEVAALNGSSTTVTAGGSFEFSVSLKEGYRGKVANTVPTVSSNNTVLTPTGNGAESYITIYKIDGISENISISVTAAMDGSIDAATLGKLLESGDVTIPSGTTVSINQGESLTVPAGRSLSFESGSTLTNYGNIVVNGTMNTASANTENYGTITVNSSNSLHILSGGTLANSRGAEINVSSTGLMDIDGSLDNVGTVNVATGGSFKVLNNGQVTNNENLGAVINLPVKLVNLTGNQEETYIMSYYGSNYASVAEIAPPVGYNFRGWILEDGSKVAEGTVNGTETIELIWNKFVVPETLTYGTITLRDDDLLTASSTSISIEIFGGDEVYMPVATVNGNYQTPVVSRDDNTSITTYTYTVSLEDDMVFDVDVKNALTTSDLELIYASVDSFSVPNGVSVVIDESDFMLGSGKTLNMDTDSMLTVSSQRSLTNRGTINASIAFSWAITLDTSSSLINSGTITANGNAIALDQSSSLINSGTITANGNAIAMNALSTVTNTGNISCGNASDHKVFHVLSETAVEGGAVSITLNSGTVSGGAGTVFYGEAGSASANIYIYGGNITSAGCVFNIQNADVSVGGGSVIFATNGAKIFAYVGEPFSFGQDPDEKQIRADSEQYLVPNGYVFNEDAEFGYVLTRGSANENTPQPGGNTSSQ